MTVSPMVRLACGPDLDDVTLVSGWASNAANLINSKSMPVARFEDFTIAGAGIAPVYNGYCLDGSIVFTDYISLMGDLRLRLVREGVRILGDGIAVGPTRTVTQQGEVDPACPRNVLERTVASLTDAGLEALMGHELEFVLTDSDGPIQPMGAWTPYGISAILDMTGFFRDLTEAGVRSGLHFEQIHAEYSPNQIEVSLPPLPPVEAADAVVLAKIVIGYVARKHGLIPSFSPVPVVHGVGNGAHQHFSLTRDGVPLFSGGDGHVGMTDEGEHAIAGVLDGLADAQAIFGGSVLSGLRLVPGLWSGAVAAWGTENREAALRFIAKNVGNPHGANVEVKLVDPSANPYLATAAILGLALRGITNRTPLVDELRDNPVGLDESDLAKLGASLLTTSQEVALKNLESSEVMTDILGPAPVAATLAVRRHEAEVYGWLDPDERACALLYGWTL